MLLHVIYVVVLYAMSMFLIKYKSAARLFGVLVPLGLAATSMGLFHDLSLFPKVKTLSVMIPLILYTNYDLMFKASTPSCLWAILFFVNMLQPGVLIGLRSTNLFDILNGLLLVVISFYCPILTHNSKTQLYGFKDNMPFAFAKTALLVSTYLFHPLFDLGGMRFPCLCSILLPLLHSAYHSDTSLYFPLRVYSLVLVFLGGVAMPQIFAEMDTIIPGAADHSDVARWAMMMVELYAVYCMIRRGTKGTVVQCFKQ